MIKQVNLSKRISIISIFIVFVICGIISFTLYYFYYHINIKTEIIEIKIDYEKYENGHTFYVCTPYIIVNYIFRKVKYENYKLYRKNFINKNELPYYDEWNEENEKNCLKIFLTKDEEKLKKGNILNSAYVTLHNPAPENKKLCFIYDNNKSEFCDINPITSHIIVIISFIFIFLLFVIFLWILKKKFWLIKNNDVEDLRKYLNIDPSKIKYEKLEKIIKKLEKIINHNQMIVLTRIENGVFSNYSYDDNFVCPPPPSYCYNHKVNETLNLPNNVKTNEVIYPSYQ